MKHLIIFFVAASSFTVFGQDASSVKSTSNFKRVQIGINVSPDVSFVKYEKIVDYSDLSTYNDFAYYLNEDVAPKMSYTFVILLD